MTNKESISVSNDDTGTYTPPGMHEIDFDKVTELQDVINILESMDITIFEGTEAYHSLKPYLKDED